MKKILIVFLLSLPGLNAWSQSLPETMPKLSPLTKEFLNAYKLAKVTGKAPEGFLYKYDASGKVIVSALIKVVNPGIVQQKLDLIGARVGTKAGNIWTVRLPYEKLEDLTLVNAISYIQMDEPVSPNLDIARKTTRVDSVQGGFNLPMRYSGKGVIVGVIDFGFDYNHPTFYDTLHANYRISRVWELNGTGTPPPSYGYGNEITDTTLIKNQGTDNSIQTHGTCVAGMAAGSGYGSNINNSRFRGMAYEAELVMVGVRRDTIATQWLQGSFTDFLDGISYIFAYADSAGKPCVVNISWGSQSGPHDGRTLFNQACNNLTGPGKILVMSAGNEGQENIHLSKTFTPTDSVVNTFLTFTSENYKRTWVDIWGDSSKTFCGQVTLYSNTVAGNTTGYFCIDDSTHDQVLVSANGLDTCFVQFITSFAEFNGRPRITIDIYNKASDSAGVSILANDGTINAWNEYYYYGYTFGYQSAFDSLLQPWAINGNTVSTVSDMGAGDSVLLVGAYASKVNFTDINGLAWTYSGYVLANRLVPFSSRGPMIDGRIKPDITAPGLTIATGVSSYDTAYTPTGSNSALTIAQYVDPILSKTFYYSEFSGTSASAPAASGIVALLLQAKPTMGPKEVHDVIAATAITDIYTGVLPPSGTNNWGHGKINAYRAMKLILGLTGIYHYEGEKLNCELFPNPGNGLFAISYSGSRDLDLKLEIYNMTGSLVKTENWPTTTGVNIHSVDLSGMPAGAYLVRVASEKGFVTIRTLVQ